MIYKSDTVTIPDEIQQMPKDLNDAVLNIMIPKEYSDRLGSCSSSSSSTSALFKALKRIFQTTAEVVKRVDFVYISSGPPSWRQHNCGRTPYYGSVKGRFCL